MYVIKVIGHDLYISNNIRREVYRTTNDLKEVKKFKSVNEGRSWRTLNNNSIPFFAYRIIEIDDLIIKLEQFKIHNQCLILIER